MSKTLQGKCWIYKRATLYDKDKNPVRILDYSNGVESFDCNSVLYNENGFFYAWSLLPNKTIYIPLNVSRNQTHSIIDMGSVPYQDGEIRWEYIYGKYKSYAEHNWEKFVEYLPLLILILILVVKILM